MQQAYIASLVKGANLPQNAIVTIINAVRRNRRNMLDATTVTTKALASEYIDQLKIRKNEISDEQWDVLRLEGYDVDGADPFSLPKTKTEFRAMLEAIAVEREQACGRLSTHMCPNTRL